MASAVLNHTAIASLTQFSALRAAQQQSWAHVFEVLREGGELSFVTIGGSVARGHGCSPAAARDAVAITRCSYPHRVVEWMRNKYPLARIDFENRAVGGQPTGSALMGLPSLAQPITAFDSRNDDGVDTRGNHSTSSRHASILLIDFAINDAFEAWTGHSRWSNFSHRIKTLDPMTALFLQVQSATEAMLRWLLVNRASSALLMVESNCWDPRFFNHTASAAHRAAAAHYGVAFLDFPAALRSHIRLVGFPSWGSNNGQTYCEACIRPPSCKASRTPVIFSDAKRE